MLRFFRIGHRTVKVPQTPSKHYNYVFFAALEGPVQVVLKRGQVSKPECHKLWLFPPQTEHCFICEPKTVRMVLAFSSVSPVVEKLLKDEPFLECALSPEELKFCRSFGRIVENHFLSPCAKSLLIFDKMLTELCLMLLKDREFPPFNSLAFETTDKIDRAIRYYTEHLSENPKIASVAHAAGVSEAHLRRLFHQVFGQSPTSFFNRLGLERAVQLLLTTSETMESIASECGFMSDTDFNRVFHKYYGCSPHIWRKHVSPLAKKRGKNERAEIDRSVIMKSIFSDLIGREES